RLETADSNPTIYNQSAVCNLQSAISGAPMKLFIDSGNIKDIETLAAIGIIDGVTTNPTLLAKEPGDYRENLKKICEIVNGPVSGEVTATDFAGMLQQGHDIGKIHQPMTVKVPLTRDGRSEERRVGQERT